MFFLISNGQDRPTILEKNKDEKYHLDFARYCVGQANNQYQSSFADKVKTNKNFYKGNQWVHNEDLDLFFKDDNDQPRNRIKIHKNIIRPMVEQYRGNAIRMGINFKVKAVSPKAINRRENELAKALHFTNVANDQRNPWAQESKLKYGVGDSEAETRAIFENNYVDKYVEKINLLLRYVSERNELEEMQVAVAEEMALTGMAVIGEYEYSGHQQFEVVKSENFFFDRSAKKYDLTDAEFMGEVIYMNVSEVFEQFQGIDEVKKTAIENYAKQYRKAAIGTDTGQMENSGKIPVFKTFWRDGDVFEYGYVLDEYGYEYLTKINFTYDGEDKPRYTDADLIRSKSERAKRLLGDDLKTKLNIDTLRMAIFIPQEIAAMGSGDSTTKEKDILLEWGIVPYQETENLDFDSVKFPYKCYCWGYVDGEVLSPIDDAINPQRFINRVLSVTENQINNSRGSGTVIDGSMVNDQAEVLQNMNQSKPVIINAKGRGIQNAVGSYDATIKQGTMVMFNIIDAMSKLTQDVTGINEALKGESTGSDQLVGVTQLLMQKGSLMQEPFYHAVTNVFKQCYQSIATRGKRIYADNERNLAIAAGDEGLEVLKITKDMKSEDFRCFIKRQNSDEMLMEAGNQMLLSLFSIQLADGSRLLSEKLFANLWGRSTPDEIGNALRKSAKEKEELERARTKELNKQTVANQQKFEEESRAAAAEMEYKEHAAEARADIESLENKKHELKKEYIRALPKIAAEDPAAKNQILEGAKNLEKPIV